MANVETSKYDEAIAALEMSVREHAEAIARHERHLMKLDSFISDIRERCVMFPTKKDIDLLRSDVMGRINMNYVLEERLDHYKERLESIESGFDAEAQTKDAKHGKAINLIVVGLFLAELMIGGAQLLWQMHHG